MITAAHVALTLCDHVYLAHRWRTGYSYIVVDQSGVRRYYWFDTSDRTAVEEAAYSAAVANLEAGAGVHVGLCRVRRPRNQYQGIRLADEPVVAALWCDLDDRELDGLAAVGIPPVAVWQTNAAPGSYHVYWSLDGDYPAGRDSDVRRVLRGIARLAGGDVAAANGQHLRGWGSFHSKPDYAGYRLNLADDSTMAGNYLDPDDCWPLGVFSAVAEEVVVVERPPAVGVPIPNDRAVSLDDLLGRLANVKRRTASSYMASCPTARHAHGDVHPSLSIKVGDQALVLKCFAGCTVDEICEALGIRVGQLFYESRYLDTADYRRRVRGG